jgi:YidC/Oxa1 family membrane protein insertase
LPEFKNPNQAGGGSGDNRSFLVMMIVMIGVVVGLNIWRAKHNPQTASPTTATVTAPQQQTSKTSVTPSSTPSVGVPAVPTVQAAAETTTTVENDFYKITFSNHGAEVRSWILKKYTDDNGQPLDMVHDGASKLYGYPLSLYTYDAALTRQLANGLYIASATGTLNTPASVTFKYASGDLSVTKTFSFGSDYVIHADTQVLRNGSPVSAPLAWPAGFGDMENAAAYAAASVDLSKNGKADHIALKKVSGGDTLTGPFDYAGMSDAYFGALFLPDHVDDATLVSFANKIDINKVDRHTGLGHGAKSTSTKPLEVPVLGTALGSASGHVETRLYVGPKGWDVLGSLHTTTGQDLHSAIDFGWWGYLAEGLFLGMRLVHSWVATPGAGPANWSWGWAIVIFTVFLNLVMLPLRVKGMKGMLKMQRIQPQVDAIKAKHGNPGPTDPKGAAMNAEVMAFQKEQGVSMLGGCVPTLITMPLLFAMFTMMLRVVELRHAHFLWLHDLSGADPWHILPIFLAASSFLVQFYTPSPGVDPQQARMMAFTMPLFSLYMTWSYASGLALYWNIGNVIMIAQQMIMNRTSLGLELRELQRERAAAKKTGSKIGGQRASTAKVIQGKR